MNHNIFRFPLIAFVSTLLAILTPSCLDDDSLEHADDLRGTFEACWQTLDQRYCFFDQKGVDWQGVHDLYAPLFRDSIKSSLQLFTVLDQMLDTLRDGHVNVYAPFNVARYWHWYEDYPINYDANLISTYYLGSNYWIASGLTYGMFGRDTIGYVRCSSFDAGIGSTNLDYMLALLRNANGLIIDIRNNGGGALNNATILAERFAPRRTLYGYIQHKTGPGHNDFSRPEPLYLEPSADDVLWDASIRPVVLLTNRHCYSSANHFVQAMRAIDGVMVNDSLGQPHPSIIKQCGDRTGGGSGLPFESVLPNGWTLRFSACPMTDAQGHSTEAGIDPSEGLRVDMDSLHAYERHRDDIIEAARAYILKNTRAPRKKKENFGNLK